MKPPSGDGGGDDVVSPAAAAATAARLKGKLRSGGGTCRMTLYCNGNPFYKGRTVCVAPTHYSKLDDLLVALDRSLPPAVAPLFGVRRLYTPAGGRQVRDLGELRDGASYVCSGTEPFKNVGYGKMKAAPWSGGNAGAPIRDKSKATGDYDVDARNKFATGGTFLPASDGSRGGHNDSYNHEGAPALPPIGHRSSAHVEAAGYSGVVLVPPLHFIARHLAESQRNALAASTDSSVLRLAEGQLRRASLNKTATVLVARPGRCRRHGGPDLPPPQRQSQVSLSRDAGAAAAAAEGGSSAVCMLLSRRGVRSFEALLADLSDAFGRRWRLNRVRQLYALSGREIRAVADLFRDDRVFVAVGRERVSRDDLARMMDALFPHEPFPRELLRALRRRYASASEPGDSDSGRCRGPGAAAEAAAEGMRHSENAGLDTLAMRG